MHRGLPMKLRLWNALWVLALRRESQLSECLMKIYATCPHVFAEGNTFQRASRQATWGTPASWEEPWGEGVPAWRGDARAVQTRSAVPLGAREGDAPRSDRERPCARVSNRGETGQRRSGNFKLKVASLNVFIQSIFWWGTLMGLVLFFLKDHIFFLSF